MELKVKGAEKILYEGSVAGFKARALDGDLVCLDNHIDYLTVLEPGELTLYDEGMKVKESIKLSGHYIMMLEQNKAVLFR